MGYSRHKVLFDVVRCNGHCLLCIRHHVLILSCYQFLSTVNVACVYVYVHVCMHACIRVCFMHTCVSACMHVSVCIHPQMPVNTCTYVCIVCISMCVLLQCVKCVSLCVLLVHSLEGSRGLSNFLLAKPCLQNYRC